MALTPEDVVNKRFQSTKFREGYDQDEVDDFLDEIVIELRRLGQENGELRQRLSAADARVAELQRAVGSAPAAAAPVPTPAPVAEPTAPPLGLDDPNGTNNLLQLARRLHEEHVREGVAKRDALIAEGETRSAQLVAEAQERARVAVSSLEGRIAGLEQERGTLQRAVDELRVFEREYRTSLKGFIEGQLRELEGGAPAPAPAASPAYAPAYATGEAPTVASAEPAFAVPPAGYGTPAAEPTPEANPFAGFAPPEQQPYGAQQPSSPFQGFAGS